MFFYNNNAMPQRKHDCVRLDWAAERHTMEAQVKRHTSWGSPRKHQSYQIDNGTLMSIRLHFYVCMNNLNCIYIMIILSQV